MDNKELEIVILTTNFNKAVMVMVELLEVEAGLKAKSQERYEMLETSYENLLSLVSAGFAGLEHKIDQIIVDTADNILNCDDHEREMNYQWGLERLESLTKK